MRYQHPLLKPLLLAITLLLAALGSAEANADMAVVVNQNNPIESLTLKEVKQLFLGRMRRFPGIDSDVDVIDRERNALLYQDFYRLVVRMEPNRLKRYRARYLFSGQGRLPETVMGQDRVIKRVRDNIASVGYVRLEQDAPIPQGLKAVYRYIIDEPEAADASPASAVDEATPDAASGVAK